MDIDASIARLVMDLLLVWFPIESCDSCWTDGRAWEVDGSTQALEGLGLDYAIGFVNHNSFQS